ncbi:hypothetical protein LTR10_004795 [Elasticomyces elasticus]|nr:hypothetical protein LTR10_004795 [Elasticomyces elasticus]KAK4977112.1 hypothetical protein LTR42_003158 [Elasticomyces elasticus]
MAGTARRSKVTAPGSRPGRSSKTVRNTQDTSKTSKQSRAAAALLQVADADTQMVDVDGPKLRVSLDYGTKNLASAILLVKPGEPVSDDVQTVHFGVNGAGNFWAPQLVARDADGKFYWGHEVNMALDAKTLDPAAAIGLCKSLLYKDYSTSEIAARVRKQLGTRSLKELLATHLERILVTVKEWTKSTSNLTADYTDEEIDAMPIELFLSVPQMWKAPANIIMTEAAKRAGVMYVELVYEPQSAAGYFAGNVKHRVPKYLGPGDGLLVADIGGGTGDFVSLGFESSSADGAKVRFTTVGTPEGDMCGSEFVNENCLLYVRNEADTEFGAGGKGGFAKLCRRLGITEPAAIRQISIRMEDIKDRFTSVNAGEEHVTLRGAQGATLAFWERPLNGRAIALLYEPVIQKIFGCIDRQLSKNTKAMIIPGGFGRSVYLLARITERYPLLRIVGQATDTMGAYQPVARGALTRYSEIKTRGLPSTESFGIGQIEEYDENVHLDAVNPPTPDAANPNPKATPNMSIVERDPFMRGVLNVYDRWVPILRKGEYKMPGHPITSEAWQQYYVDANQKEITQQVYWTESDIQPHERILEQGKGELDVNARLRPDIEPWGEPLVFDVSNLQSLGFELKPSDTGKVYEIWYRLKLTCNGANISITFQIAKAFSKLHDDNGLFVPEDEVELTKGTIHEVVAASYNQIPRTAPT